MNLKHQLLSLGLLLVFATSLCAQVLTLKPGESKTVTFTQLRYLEKGALPNSYPVVSGKATLSLALDGKTLSVQIQNLSTEKSGVTLYGFELGLTSQQAVQTRAEVQFSGFPPNVYWIGPTDNNEVTAGNGVFAFVSRDAALRNFDEFLKRDQPLPASFLTAGQQGSFTVKLDMSAYNAGKSDVLKLSPMMYFLSPDPASSSTKRLRMAARLNLGNSIR